MKEKLSTTGMGTHSPHSFWNGKLATKFNVEVFFWIVWHSFFVFVFLALINGFAGFRFHLLHLYGIENGILILFSHVIKTCFYGFRLIWKSCICFDIFDPMLLKIPTLPH